MTHNTLATLTARTGLTVLDHLEQQVTIPVHDGLQAQGDLMIVPFALVAADIHLFPQGRWSTVPTRGTELLRGAAGGNPHTLIPEPGRCRWTNAFTDRTGLGLTLVDTDVVAYVLHPEHGATGLAPGRYVIRRQREHDGRAARFIAD